MTALELNAELFRQLSIIAEDETLMRKAVEAIRNNGCEVSGMVPSAVLRSKRKHRLKRLNILVRKRCLPESGKA